MRTKRVSEERLRHLISGLTGKCILLVGDVVADHYIMGKSSRLSREAPVIILKYQEETVVPGQAGNTAANVAALGGKSCLVGVVGIDARGTELMDALENAGVNVTGVVRSDVGKTLTKTRILAGGHHTARQQVIRIDDDERMAIGDPERIEMMAAIEKIGPTADAIIVSDYGYGCVNKDTWELALKVGRERSIPVVLDSRYALTQWQGATLITPNEEEALAVASVLPVSQYKIEDVGAKVRELSGCQNLIITRGNEGMVLFPPDGEVAVLPIFGSDECTDVTGAGDTVVATATLALAAGASPFEAMTLSNLAGALVVMKVGTATVSEAELIENLPLIETAMGAR